MNKITCTNCQESFSVSEEHYKSNMMIFNCNFCGVEIKRNEANNKWEAIGKKPVPLKPKISPTPSMVRETQKPRTLLGLIDEWRGRVVTIGWFLAIYNFSLLFVASEVMPLAILAIFYNIAQVLLAAYFISVLLACLSKHLENQQEMIKLLKSKET